MRVQTRDASYFSSERLGANTHFTNEGYLLCTNVPISRTGNQLYREGEVPVDANSGGDVVVERTENEVFRPETIASFNGKSVTLEHPMLDDPMDEGWDVNPDNVQDHEVGVILNPRRGEGQDRDFTVADLLIKRRDAIEAVQRGKLQVSCGYDATYQTLGPGHGRQIGIIGNHVALVDLARCGPSCSIRDGASDMTTTTTKTRDRWTGFIDSLRGAAFNRKDPVEFDAVIARARDELVSTGEGTNVHVHLNQTGEAAEELGSTVTDVATAKKTADALDALTKSVKFIGDSLVQVAGVVARMARDKEDEEEEKEEEMRDAKSEEDDEMTSDRHGRDRRGRDRARDKDDDEEEKEKEKEKETKDAMTEIFPGLVKLQDPESDATGVTISGGIRSAEGTSVARDSFRVRLRARSRDSSHLEVNYRDVISRAEILLPGGFRAPAFDAATPAYKTVDALCGMRKRVLAAAWKTEDGRSVIEPIAGWQDEDISRRLSGLTCDGVMGIYNGASEIARRANNTVGGGMPRFDGPRSRDHGIQSIGDVNARNREFYNHSKTTAR